MAPGASFQPYSCVASCSDGESVKLSDVLTEEGRTWLLTKLRAYADPLPCKWNGGLDDVRLEVKGDALLVGFTWGELGGQRCYDFAPLKISFKELEPYLALGAQEDFSRLNASGMMWVRHFGSNYEDDGACIAVDGDGRVLIAAS